MAEQYLYVMGAGSGAGKSTVCMGILAQLIADGYAPGELAYIKPVTQCTDTQAVTLFCQRIGIAHRESVLVFSKGFTRNFIAGLTKDAASLKHEVLTGINRLGANKKIVLIDGIGDPATGSLVGLSNAGLAKALSAKVIFVGRPGIGAAIDNIVLCVSFIQSRGLDNIGLIINKLPSSRLSETKAYVSQRLAELFPSSTFLGAVANDDQLEAKLGHVLTVEAIDRWFSACLEKQTLLCWMGLTIQG